MVPATQLKVGMIIYYNKRLCRVIGIEHITPGNKRGLVQSKLRDLEAGTLLENRFRSDEIVDVAMLEKKDMEYLYEEGDAYFFMDTVSFEQIPIQKATAGDAAAYMHPNVVMTVHFCDGKPVIIEPPNAVTLTVTETDPPLKGATQSGSKKPAKLETGMVVQVPQFIVSGERVVIDTRDGSFLERSKE